MFHWHIPDGYIAPGADGTDSHESWCITNDGDQPVAFTVEAFFADRVSTRIEDLRIDARSNIHLRTDVSVLAPLELRVGDPYGLRIASLIPLHVQYSRLVETTAGSMLMTAVPPRVDE